MAILGEIQAWMETDEFRATWSMRGRKLGEIVTWWRHRDGDVELALFDSGHAKFFAVGDPEPFDTLRKARARAGERLELEDVAA